jgi:Predicted membrane protein
MELIHPLFKWLHIIAGITWIGLLYFFNWINGHFAATLDADTKKKVIPELMPRALYWFRWGAAWTWVTGVVLLLIVFYHGGLTFDDGDWNANAFIMIAVTFFGVFLYDALYKTGLAGNVRVITIISFVLIAGITYLMKEWAGFSYRSFNIP